MKTIHIIVGSNDDEFLFTSYKHDHSWVFGLGGRDIIEDISPAGVIDTKWDTMWGNDGNDVLISHAGWDLMFGGSGDDILIIDKQLDDAKNVRVRGNAGHDQLIIIDDNTEPLDKDAYGADGSIDLGDYIVRTKGIESVGFMTSEAFEEFRENGFYHSPNDFQL